MRRWFKVSPVRCRVCASLVITLIDILRDGAAFDDGTFECGKCLRASKILEPFYHAYHLAYRGITE